MIIDESIFLKHILSAVDEIEKFTKGVGREDFLRSSEKQSAVVRQLEIIGEAVKNLSEEFKSKQSDIPWRDISSMRDNLIHEYFGVDLEVVWETVKEDLADLKSELLKIID